jgi:hypothetical protein
MHSGVGGEIFIPFIPLIVWVIKDSIRDMKEVINND